MTDKNHLYISNSSQSLLHACARKFEFQKMYSHPRRESGLKAELGKALHMGYQDFLIHQDMDKAILAYMLAYPIHLCDSPTDYSSLEAGYYTLMGMIHASDLMEYEVAKIKCLDGNVRPAIEVPFEIILDGYSLDNDKSHTVSYVGYIDAILYNKREQNYVVVDIKTTQWALDDYTPLYQYAQQCVPYGFVLEYMKGEKIDQFEVKYLSCRIDLLNPKITLYPFMKSKEDIEDWFRGLIIDLNLVKMYKQMAWWPRTGNGSGCITFKQKCNFFDICFTRDREIIKQIIEDTESEGNADKTKEQIDEALRSKTLKETFDPWVKFNLEVGNGV